MSQGWQRSVAEGRFVSKTIAQSEQLGRVSLEADYLFGRCIPHLDREGRMTGNPELVRAQACPLRPELTTEKVATLIAELATVELVIWYEVGARQCLTFPGFDRHQKGLRKEREATSRIPPADSANAKPVVYSRPTPEESGRTPAQCNAMEVKGSSSSVPTEPATAAQENVYRQIFPLIREHLWLPDKKCPTEIAGKPWSEDQEGTVIRELHKAYSVSDLEVIVLGLGTMLRGLAEAERPEWLSVGAKASLRAVFHTRSGVVQMVEKCRRAYWAVENRKPKKPSKNVGITDAITRVAS